MRPSEKRERAAEILARTGNASEAARAAEVNRSTVTRWLQTPEFQRLVVEAQENETTGDVSEQATKSLSDLVSQAVSVIERALEGDKSLVSSGRLALDVITKAAALAPKGSKDDAPPLADLIAELDKREKG